MRTKSNILRLLILQIINYTSNLNTHFENRMQPGYNDIGLYDTSPITSDILCDQLIPHCSP